MGVNGPNSNSGVNPSAKISPAVAAATSRTNTGMSEIEPHRADTVLNRISTLGQCVYAGCQFARALTA